MRNSNKFELKEELELYREMMEEEKKEREWIKNWNDKPESWLIEEVYWQYKTAMERRRQGSALEYQQFYDYILREDVECFRWGYSYVFGGYREGIFFPSHFAPASLKEGMLIMQALQKERVALLVPDDLATQAEKLGFIRIQTKIPCQFRGELILKNLLVSNRKLIPELKRMQEELIC